ncbi:hypothetical protein O9Z70_11815 [Devosia sp. YIM 151766]|uniref:hypothetical protein n=1 Tax=Devosia sp. YIM 151766 TaxID=3017325 RepID=UPI00255CF667|nr:hypothetical protein [Devosia sp. YIM 151766]WIY52148.1 hypothetical protein O9Z70_11815 [Devosia sp. YIM 151766]
MTVDNVLDIYGTMQPPAELRRLNVGRLELCLGEGAVRGLFWDGVEVLRGVDYPVRDSNWGTFSAQTLDEELQQTNAAFTYRRRFRTGDGKLEGTFSLVCSGEGAVCLVFDLDVLDAIEINRAGFVILHPVTGFAGAPIRVGHTDGRVEDSAFPDPISAGQPLFDIASISQSINGVSARIDFAGEVFEMEDQRNWSDASYKTYCRPLSWQRPYILAPGSHIRQSIDITIGGEGVVQAGAASAALALGSSTYRPVPEIALALEDGWQGTSSALEAFADLPALLRLDLTDRRWPEALHALLKSISSSDLDLEVVLPDGADDAGQCLRRLHDYMDDASRIPRCLVALPAAYLKSYQPDGAWPTSLSPVDAASMARGIFRKSLIGGGVLTNFTELNRYPAAASAGDFVTHNTTAIVHAADDRSVMQSLEALPHIFASAEKLAAGRPYRLGLVSIGMRSNPYGEDVADNPERIRCPMAMHDPRQQGLFAAAFMVGAVAATQASGVESLALAAPSGPFGLVEGQRIFPAYHAFLGLSRLAGLDRRAVEAPDWCAAVAARSGDTESVILANLTPDPQRIFLPRTARYVVLDRAQNAAQWLNESPRQSGTAIALGPYAVAFASSGTGDLFRNKS